MIKNYFKIAFRNIGRHRGYSVINITGLAIGMAACLLLFLVIHYETSYDAAQPRFGQIYHVVTQDKYEDGITYNGGIPSPALQALRTEFPDLLFAALDASYGSQVSVGTDKKFIEPLGVFFTEPQWFQLFDYRWAVGGPAVLKEPNTVVLTKSVADRYFGDWKLAEGKIIKLDNGLTLKVAGILENTGMHTDFPIALLISLSTLNNSDTYSYQPKNWGGTSSNFQIFTLLPQSVKPAAINQRLLAFSRNHYANASGNVSTKTNSIEPLSNLHFDTRFDSFGTHLTNKSTLWTLSLIGLFIIVMACINFVNLATAQAVGRSKEVGIRKVLGSSRAQLFLQVMGETFLLVVIAGLIAVGIATLCIPLIGQIASIEEPLSIWNGSTILFLLSIVAIVTVLAGLYPSLILSGFKPALALKNRIGSAKVGGISLRRGLVVVQFVISQVLIVGTIVALSQMSFIKHADLGFSKEAVLLLSGNSDSSFLSRENAFREQLLQTPGVQSVSLTSDAPSSTNGWYTNFAYDHRPDEKFQLAIKFGDENYLKTFGLQLVAGRVYEKSDTTREVLINETLVHKLGLKDPQQAIGKEMRTGTGSWHQIVGVVHDFRTTTLKTTTPPLMIGEAKRFYSVAAIKLRSSNIAQAQASIQAIWNTQYPEYAYAGDFLDDNIDNFYQQENHLSLLYKIFAGLALLISSLGLYGLVSFMAVQKTKEVGIRKVLGASVQHIVYLFSREFTVLILIAFAIAVPIAYFMMSKWLQDFAYRIHLGVWVFMIAIGVSVVIAWLTVGYKAIKAAIVNPVKSLRSE